MNRIRRQLMVLVSIWLVVATGLFGQTSASPAAGPRAQLSERSVNFGKVLPSEIKRHEFVVTNTGSELLVISAVNPGCGCTTAGNWDREIAPGKSGRIGIEFNPANFSGAVTKSIAVTCNDPAQPNLVLEIHALVWRPLDVQPAFVSFLPVDGEPAAETKVIRIVNNAEQPASLEPPQSTNPNFKTELKTIRAGREFELHITYESAVAAATPNATISILTSSPDQPVLTVTAFAMPQPPLAIFPASIELPAAPANGRYQHTIVIRNNGRAALQLTEPATTVVGAEVSIQEQIPGKVFHLTVALPKEFKPDSGESAIVSVKTSHPKFPIIRVPIVAAPPKSTAAK